MIDDLLVYLDSPGDEAVFVGEVFFTAKGGVLVSSMFSYDTSYIERADAFAIDPELPLRTGGQPVAGLPGTMQDCSPDRWGRNIITKGRRAAAREEGQRAHTLTDADFLVGVGDFSRQGALRFRARADGPFLGEGGDVPKLIALPLLLDAADAVGSDEDFAAIKTLLEAGTGSLGGARPKASIADGDRLLIAKFPHRDDEWDVMAWEKTALDLASAAGITVPRTRLTRIDDRAVLLLDRFDRRAGNRVPYMSAMTLLGARDGGVQDYVDIAEAMAPVSAAARTDLNELWRRVVYSIIVNNTDDHLRNHGLLHEQGGWRMSPAFDLNPNPDTGTSRQTGIAGAYVREDALDAALEYATVFDLTSIQARDVIDQVTVAVSGWREAAKANGLSVKEMTLFDDAFWSPD